MHTSTSGSSPGSPATGPTRLADALGWSSSLLGAPMLLAPRRFLRFIGVEPDRTARAWTLVVGVREHLATLNVVANRQRRIGIWSRVLGDTMDLALLAAAYRHKRADGPRLRRAMGTVGGVLAVDLATATLLTRADGAHVRDGSDSVGVGVDHGAGGGPARVRTAVTIRRPVDDVREAFREFDWTAFSADELEAAGDVRFVPAPGDRGCEVHLDHDPGSGVLRTAAAKLAGSSPDQVIGDELRRFKALQETGVVPASGTAPEGASSRRQILHKREPAQPVGGGD